MRCCQIAGEHARRVERVLDVRQGELCWVAGTIYMDLPLKPNILDDLTKEVEIVYATNLSIVTNCVSTALYGCATASSNVSRPVRHQLDTDHAGR